MARSVSIVQSFYDCVEERNSTSRNRLDGMGVSRYEPDFQVSFLCMNLRSMLSSFEEPRCISSLETTSSTYLFLPSTSPPCLPRKPILQVPRQPLAYKFLLLPSLFMSIVRHYIVGLNYPSLSETLNIAPPKFDGPTIQFASHVLLKMPLVMPF